LSKCSFLLLVLCFITGYQQLAISASTVWLAPPLSTQPSPSWYARPVTKHAGKLIQFDHKEVVIFDEEIGQQVRFASARVIWIEVDELSFLEKQLRQSFEKKDDNAVLSGLTAVLMERPPVWRQQWLTMLAAIAAYRTNRGEISLDLIRQLDQRPLPLMVLAWLPIAWTNKPMPQSMTGDAMNQLSNTSEITQLTASSWLLSSPQREVAIQKLKSLELSERFEISTFAKLLLWRVSNPQHVLQSVERWKTTALSLPMVLQTGPLVLIKDKLLASGSTEAAKHLQWSIDAAPIMQQLQWIDSR